MTKSNIAEVVNEWAEKALQLLFTTGCDLIPTADADGACVRHDPALPPKKIFRRAPGEPQPYIYVRMKNAEQARELSHSK